MFYAFLMIAGCMLLFFACAVRHMRSSSREAIAYSREAELRGDGIWVRPADIQQPPFVYGPRLQQVYGPQSGLQQPLFSTGFAQPRGFNQSNLQQPGVVYQSGLQQAGVVYQSGLQQPVVVYQSGLQKPGVVYQSGLQQPFCYAPGTDIAQTQQCEAYPPGQGGHPES